MNENGTVIFKMWFKNGVYIEKKVEVKKMDKKDEEDFLSGIIEVQSTVKNSFREDKNAQISLQGMTVRVSELMVFEFDFLPEEEPEEEKAEEVLI